MKRGGCGRTRVRGMREVLVRQVIHGGAEAVIIETMEGALVIAILPALITPSGQEFLGNRHGVRSAVLDAGHRRSRIELAEVVSPPIISWGDVAIKHAVVPPELSLWEERWIAVQM